jgi:hypothetical protein
MRIAGPTVLIVAGVALASAGFLYDVAFAGIPYPDPTPEQQASWAFHADVAGRVRHAGGLVAAAGLVWSVGRWGMRRVLRQGSR